MNDNSKTIAVLSYIMPVGWLIALILYNSDQQKSTFARFHLRQGLGIVILGIALLILWIILSVLFSLTIYLHIIGSLFTIIYFLSQIGLLVFSIIGLINASEGKENELPLIGKTANEKLTFIS